MEYYCKITKEDDLFVAEFPDLPEVLTYGDSEEEALHHAAGALNGAIASDISRGLDIPKPVTYDGLRPVELDAATSVALQLRLIRGSESQTAIASKLGLSYQAYQRLENPTKGNPTVKTLARVASALGKNSKSSSRDLRPWPAPPPAPRSPRPFPKELKRLRLS